MKKLTFIMTALVAVGLMASCNKQDNDYVPMDDTISFNKSFVQNVATRSGEIEPVTINLTAEFSSLENGFTDIRLTSDSDNVDEAQLNIELQKALEAELGPDFTSLDSFVQTKGSLIENPYECFENCNAKKHPVWCKAGCAFGIIAKFTDIVVKVLALGSK